MTDVVIDPEALVSESESNKEHQTQTIKIFEREILETGFKLVAIDMIAKFCFEDTFDPKKPGVLKESLKSNYKINFPSVRRPNVEF